MGVGFLLVGPLPFMTSLPTSTGLIKGSAAVIGTGYTMVMVSTFGRSQRAAIRNGFNDGGKEDGIDKKIASNLQGFLFHNSEVNPTRLCFFFFSNFCC